MTNVTQFTIHCFDNGYSGSLTIFGHTGKAFGSQFEFEASTEGKVERLGEPHRVMFGKNRRRLSLKDNKSIVDAIETEIASKS